MNQALTSTFIPHACRALRAAGAASFMALLLTTASAESPWRWERVGQSGGPGLRTHAVVVWTGHEILVWGGGEGDDPHRKDWLNDGWRYNPSTDSWTPMATLGAPEKRRNPIGVWTGTELIVWGGHTIWGTDSVKSGARYNPTTDTWLPISADDAPRRRGQHTMTWTGSELIVWGGYRPTRDCEGDDCHDDDHNDPDYHDHDAHIYRNGGRYDPRTDTWKPTSSKDAPSRRADHSAVWTGSELVIWGGGQWSFDHYDPVTDQWRAGQAFVGTPITRTEHAAIWTGSQMIIWGGTEVYQDRRQKDGARYDPVTGKWTTLPSTDAPSKRTHHAYAWTGREMIIWGGAPNKTSQSGGLFNPNTNTWSTMPTEGGPADGDGGTSVWTGEAFYVFYDGLYRAYEEGPYALDGLPDEWQRLHFGPNNPDGTASHDPDGDGSDNTLEFLATTDPTDPQSKLQFRISTNPATHELQFDLSPCRPDRHYRLEQSTGLPPLEWLPVEGNWTATSENHWIHRHPTPGVRQMLYRIVITLE